VFFTVTTAPGTAAKSGTGTVATLTFKAEAQGTSNLEITPDSLAVAIREGGNNVLQNRTGVAITVGTVGGQGDLDPTPSPTPTASPSPSPSPTAAPTKVSIGDRVWNDTNKDGIQDASENGIQGVTVSLLNGSGTVLSNTTTDPSGYYGFTNFDPGTYMIQFNLTSGFGFTTKDQGSDDAKDSDADPTTGKTGSITLSAGQVQYTWDAGFIASTTSTTSSSGGITFATPTATPLKTATPKPTSTASASGTPKPPSELPDTGMDAPTILALGLAGGVFLVGSGFYVASRKAE
jgi:LPXTG-motif cell wall-anchored protein